MAKSSFFSTHEKIPRKDFMVYIAIFAPSTKQFLHFFVIGLDDSTIHGLNSYVSYLLACSNNSYNAGWT